MWVWNLDKALTLTKVGDSWMPALESMMHERLSVMKSLLTTSSSVYPRICTGAGGRRSEAEYIRSEAEYIRRTQVTSMQCTRCEQMFLRCNLHLLVTAAEGGQQAAGSDQGSTGT